jgi:arylsulfatase A-like enzyme
MSRPNIVFMIADDHRYNAIHALGNAEVRTPHFDQLVHQGTALTHTYIMGSTSGAVCMPSRAMLLTGRSLFHSAEVPTAYPYRIPEYAQLLPEAFREQGYMTYGVGKWHNPKSAYARCFEGGANIFFGGMSDHDKVPIHDFDPTGAYPDDQQYIGRQYSTDLFGDAAIDFLENYTDERPFFLYVAFTAPHDPRTPPPEFEYDPASVSVPENFLPEHPFDNGVLDIRDELLAPFPRTPEIVQQHIADYYGMISDLDDKVGQILKTLENRGLAENTIVVYTADHGLSVGQHGLLGKQNLYDHSVRVPLILRGPGIPANARRDALCYLYDMYPTLCELTDVPIALSNEGQSLVALITGAKSTHRDSVFSAYQSGVGEQPKFQRMLRSGHTKLIEYSVEGVRHTQLFDLQADPAERFDLAGDARYQAQITQLRQELAAWQVEVDDPCPLNES